MSSLGGVVVVVAAAVVVAVIVVVGVVGVFVDVDVVVIVVVFSSLNDFRLFMNLEYSRSISYENNII